MIDCKVLDMDLNSQSWVVRAGNGSEFFNHFIDNKLAAIGHFDEFITSISKIDESGFEDIVRSFYADAKKKELSQQMVSANVNQVRKFIFDMKVGDIIFTLGDNNVVAGVITSDAYLSEGLVSRLDDSPLSVKDLSFKIRRNVEWGRSYPKNDIPVAVRRTFWANQTVFSASEHTQSIYHWLNTVFISGQTIYASSKINQKGHIHHYSVSQLSNTLNKLEALSKVIEVRMSKKQSLDDITLDEVTKCLHSLARDNLLTLTTQQSFMSPGDYWTGYTGDSREAIVAFALAFCVLFGVKPTFAEASDMKVAITMEAPIKKLVQEIKNDNEMAIAENKLELSFPYQNKKVIEKTEEIRKSKFPRVENSDKGIR